MKEFFVIDRTERGQALYRNEKETVHVFKKRREVLI